MSIGNIYRLRSCLKKYRDFLKKNHGKAKYVFMATPRHKNLGDHAIVYAQAGFLKRIKPDAEIFEISKLEYETYSSIIKHMTDKDTVIIVDGGGNLGTLWPEEDAAIRRILTDFRHNKVIVFPQTAYYDADKTDLKITFADIVNRHDNVLLTLRDEESYSLFKDIIQEEKLLLCPDIAMSLDQVTKGMDIKKRDEIGLCIRDDKESVLGQTDMERAVEQAAGHPIKCSRITTFADHNIYPEEREKVLNDKWAEFASYRLVITDRLHGMIFAAITGTPCIVFDNLSRKVSGAYEWLRSLKYIQFCNDISELKDALQNAEQTISEDELIYDRDSIISGHYDRIEKFLGRID